MYFKTRSLGKESLPRRYIHLKFSALNWIVWNLALFMVMIWDFSDQFLQPNLLKELHLWNWEDGWLRKEFPIRTLRFIRNYSRGSSPPNIFKGCGWIRFVPLDQQDNPPSICQLGKDECSLFAEGGRKYKRTDKFQTFEQLTEEKKNIWELEKKAVLFGSDPARKHVPKSLPSSINWVKFGKRPTIHRAVLKY